MNKATRTNNFNVEKLEDRRLLSSVQLVDGMLIIEGKANGHNRLGVTPDGNGTTLFARANGAKAHFDIKDVKSIRIIGGEKRDNVYVDASFKIDAYVRTGAGRDSVVTGSGNDTVFGGGDADTLRGGAGDDMLIGGAGRDRLDAGKGDDPLRINPTPSKNYNVAVTSFTLIDANTNKPIGTLAHGSKLNLAKLPDRLNVVANLTPGGENGSVSFDYDGQHVRHENLRPLALAADNNGNFYSWTPKAGVHTLVATPFSGKNGTGDAGAARTITFTVFHDKRLSGGLLGSGGSNSDNSTDNNGGSTPTVDKNAPVAVIDLQDASVPLGHAIHASALKSTLKTGDVLGAKFEWDFGDKSGTYNKLTGFNAGHAYSRTGTYKITLKVTDSAGRSNTATATVTITDAKRRYVYVSPGGNDANTGRTTGSAVKTFERAAQLVADNTEVLFQRGATWSTKATLNAGHENVVVGAYGSGNAPVIRFNGKPGSYDTLIATMGGKNVTVRDLAFDSTNTSKSDIGYNEAIRVGGANITVRGNTFINVGYAINNNGHPDGVLIQDNKTTRNDSVRAYFAWVQGTNFTIVGNKVHDSIQQHAVRVSGAERVLVAHNDLQNLTNPSGGIKGTVTVQVASHVYITGNTLKAGAVGIGPLNGGAGLETKNTRTKWVVIESNLIVDSPVNLSHGLEHAMVRNNVIRRDDGIAIDMPGWSDEYDRGTRDVYIVRNTVINNGTGGKFLKVGGKVERVTVSNNLFVAPNFETGVGDSAPMVIKTGDLSGFRVISENVWPVPTIHPYAEGGINWVGTTGNNECYKTPAEWEAYSQVKRDQYKDVTLTTSYKISLGGITAGSSLKKAA